MAKLRTLQHITLGRLELALDDLLSKRNKALVSFPYGAFIITELTQTRDKIAALPEALKSKPFAGELAALDVTHDGFGAACWFFVEGYLRAPTTTPEERKALKDIRDVLGILDEITAAYDVEAKAAQRRKSKLPGIATQLAMFPLTGGKTLADWANGYADAGISIGARLSDRADAKDRALANLLRSETVGVVNEARRQLARALKKDPTLPSDLDAQIFSWFDDLEQTSAEEAAEEKKKEEAAKKAQGTPPAAAAPADPAKSGP